MSGELRVFNLVLRILFGIPCIDFALFKALKGRHYGSQGQRPW
jgi:hypothetical protein